MKFFPSSSSLLLVQLLEVVLLQSSVVAAVATMKKGGHVKETTTAAVPLVVPSTTAATGTTTIISNKKLRGASSPSSHHLHQTQTQAHTTQEEQDCQNQIYLHDGQRRELNNKSTSSNGNDFTLTNITCEMLPIIVESDVTFDMSLDLSHCPEDNDDCATTIFKVRNNPTIDCDDFSVQGFDGSTAFEVWGGLTLKNCNIEQHQIGIIRKGGYLLHPEDGNNNKKKKTKTCRCDCDLVTITDSTISNVRDGIFVNVDKELMDADMNVRVIVENSNIVDCKYNGIIMYAHGQLEVTGTTITPAAATDSEDGILINNKYNTISSVWVQNCTISGFDDAAIEIGGNHPSRRIRIKDSDLRDCSWGVWIEVIFPKDHRHRYDNLQHEGIWT